MISNTVMPRSQIPLFAGHLCAHKREIFSAQIVLQPKIPTAVFHAEGKRQRSIDQQMI